MSLVEHLRELRTRLVKSLLALVPGAILGWIYYKQLLRFVLKPGCDAGVRGVGNGPCSLFVTSGLTGPINLAVSASLVTGIALASPVWLYQIWAFVTPGLHRHERRWSLAFLATAVPLFFAGAGLCYAILPKIVKVLLGFTPQDATASVNVQDYLSIVGHLMIAFGLAFELPVFVVLLNAVGVLPAKGIERHWRGIVFGIFLFAAVATPTGDPYTMMALALPMILLLGIAYLFCLWNDRRRRVAAGEPDYGALADDEVSPL